MFPTVSYISIVFIGLIIIPTVIFEYRKANILRRIEDSGNKKIAFIWAMSIFFTILFFMTYFFNCLIGTLSMFNNEQIQIM
jgi:choline-glycine betaine transporter